jgi:hypothetical protein
VLGDLDLVELGDVQTPRSQESAAIADSAT